MKRPKYHTHVLLLIILLIVTNVLFFSYVSGDALANNAAMTEEKIDPLVLEQLAASGETDFFIWMHGVEADLAPAAALEKKAERGAFVYNELRAKTETLQADVRSFLDKQEVAYRPFFIANKIYVPNGSEALIRQLATRPDVAQITANRRFQLPEVVIEPNVAPNFYGIIRSSVNFVNADRVWAMGYDGTGFVLATSSTGLDWDHPALINQYRGWNGSSANHNYSWWDATGTYPTAPDDGNGHGTMLTSPMVGDSDGSEQIGMAPGARTIHCKSLDDLGYGSEATLTECMEWYLAPWDLAGNNPDPAMAPHAVNQAWGAPGGNVPLLEDEIAALRAAGIVVVAAAGNDGPNCGTLMSPGDYDQVITVGGVEHFGYAMPGEMHDTSSRGASDLYPGSFIPDLMAPGRPRVAIPGGGFTNYRDTGMAAAHVTGLIALLWDAVPDLVGDPLATEQLILDTAVPLTGETGSNCGGDYTDGPNQDWGHGTIDALAAVEKVLKAPVVHVSSSSNGTVGNISFRDEDILTYHTELDSWSLLFDGSDVGATADLDAFAILDHTSILMSFNLPVSLPDSSGTSFSVDDADIVQFFAQSVGENTTGYFEMYLRGADVGLDPSSGGEDIDAITLTEEGALIISTVGNFRVPGPAGELRGRDEDLLLVDTDNNTLSLYIDGSDVGLGEDSTEDVWGATVDEDGDIYLTTQGAFNVPGLAGDGDDIFICTPLQTGDETACSFTAYWNGDDHGFGGEVIDSFAVVHPTRHHFYVTSSGNGSLVGIDYKDEDILTFDVASETWSLFFDGSDVSTYELDLDAFVVLDDSTILMSFNAPVDLRNQNYEYFSVDDSDIVQFFGQSFGVDTAGYFEMYLRGADVGLTTNGEDLDAITLTDDGDLIISTIGSFRVPGPSGELRGSDEDLLLVDTDSNVLSMYFDGSDVGLGEDSSEDVWGTWVDANGDIYLSTQGTFVVPGLSGDGSDIFVCTPGSVGNITSCEFSLYWDGTSYLGSNKIDGFAVIR